MKKLILEDIEKWSVIIDGIGYNKLSNSNDGILYYTDFFYLPAIKYNEIEEVHINENYIIIFDALGDTIIFEKK